MVFAVKIVVNAAVVSVNILPAFLKVPLPCHNDFHDLPNDLKNSLTLAIRDFLDATN